MHADQASNNDYNDDYNDDDDDCDDNDLRWWYFYSNYLERCNTCNTAVGAEFQTILSLRSQNYQCCLGQACMVKKSLN